MIADGVVFVPVKAVECCHGCAFDEGQPYEHVCKPDFMPCEKYGLMTVSFRYSHSLPG